MKNAKKSKEEIVFQKKLGTKLTLFFLISSFLIIVLLSSIFYTQSYHMLVGNLGERAVKIGETAAKGIDAEAFKALQTIEQEKDDSYSQINKELNYMRRIVGAKFLYTMRKNAEGQYEYVVDGLDLGNEDFSHIGDKEEEILSGYELVWEGHPYVSNKIEVTEWGTLLSSYYPIKDKSNQVVGFVGVDYDVEQEYMSFLAFRRVILFLAIGISMIAAGLGYLFSRQISKPMEKMAVMAQKLATYDLNVEKVHIKNKDEIGALAHSFNQMTDNLKGMMTHITEAAQRINESSMEVNQATQESSFAVNQITESISHIASGSEDTSNQIEGLNQILTHLTASAQQTACNTEQAENMAIEMSTSATKGGRSVEEIIKQIQHIDQSTEDTSRIIKELNDKTKDIHSIIQIINQISEQTNLLALNANIEAARAGDLGRGFAVVAQEVRKLAEESKNYADKIADMIFSVTENTQKAVNSMASVKGVVGESIETAQKTKKVFDELLHRVTDTTGIIEEIATATEEQSKNNENILKKAHKVSLISQEATKECENTVGVVEETLASIEAIVTSTQQLTDLAQDLNQLVSSFKMTKNKA